MKILGTIKSIKLSRKYQRKSDGSIQNVFAVTFESGDDTIVAESFHTREGMQRRGIVQGAIGTVTIALNVRQWTDRDGVEHDTQDIQLRDFALANRNISTEAAQSQESSDTPSDAPAQEEAVDGAEAGQINPETEMTF